VKTTPLTATFALASALAKCFPAASAGNATETISAPNAAAPRFELKRISGLPWLQAFA
jgi:hypothetical protein